jgi:predicted transcriptional regulator
MAGHRCGLEIMAEILNACKIKAKKTRIMYIANLSCNHLKRYLKETLKFGLIYVNGEEYKVTEKGEIFLEKYEKFRRKYRTLLKELEK